MQKRIRRFKKSCTILLFTDNRPIFFAYVLRTCLRWYIQYTNPLSNNNSETSCSLFNFSNNIFSHIVVQYDVKYKQAIYFCDFDASYDRAWPISCK